MKCWKAASLNWRKPYMRKLLTGALNALVITYCAIRHRKDGIMDMLKVLFASKVLMGQMEFEAVPRLLKPGVAQEIIDAGMPELVPAEYGGTLAAE